jgi:aspartyl protease family protein
MVFPLRPLAGSVLATLFLLSGIGPAFSAQSVALAGLLGTKALIVVNGSQPRSLAVGESYQGVKLVSMQGDQADVEIAGTRQTLRLGGAPASVAGAAQASEGASKIVLSADTRGHFVTQGQINGHTATMMVDTGASYVSLSTSEAQRIGLDYKAGQALAMSTANGVIPAWRVKLNNLRVGEVVLYDMDALVSSGVMPFILLGNNFLGRFQMTRTNDQMVLDKRF